MVYPQPASLLAVKYIFKYAVKYESTSTQWQTLNQHNCIPPSTHSRHVQVHLYIHFQVNLQVTIWWTAKYNRMSIPKHTLTYTLSYTK